ncbi:MAG: hydrolase [Deltaproteobacteria bacterium]|nr:MAG: hydrolase [Deltaproteobacteria bacterium]
MDVVARAKAFQESVRPRSREIEEARRFPADLARTMAEAGLFRMAVPRSLGGLEVEAATLLRAIELIGEADGSVNCQWLMGGSAILEDGKPRLLPNGMLDSRLLVFPTAQATLIDSWFAAGLCGTGSGDMEVRELRVPVTRSVSLVTDRPVEGGPLYVFPVFGLLALGIGAVALGIARAAITDLVALAGGKKPQGSTRTLAERATAQTALAEAEARLRAARAFFYEAVGEAWARATGAGDISLEERAALRLAATHATRVAADVARTVYDLGGGSSVHLSSPLQRRFRDAHVATQHVLVSPATLELAGRVLMGLPTDATML